MDTRADRTRVVISGKAMTTPKSLPVATRVWCAGCQRSYDITTDQLILEGFVCDCGRLSMPARFRTTTEPTPPHILTPRPRKTRHPRRRYVGRV